MAYQRPSSRFDPPFPCPRCGVELQVVWRTYGRSATEELATGRQHYCKVVAARLDKIIANASKPQRPKPTATRPTRPSAQPSVQQRTPAARAGKAIDLDAIQVEE